MELLKFLEVVQKQKKIPSGPKALNKSLGKGKDKISIDVPAGATEGTIKAAGKIQTPQIVDTKKLELEKTKKYPQWECI